MLDTTTSETSDTTIPEIEIAHEWYVSDLETVEACDDALAVLTEAVCNIERQLHLERMGEQNRGARWQAGAMTSLTWKRHAREAVTRKRAVFASEERRALEWIKEHKPEWIKEAIASVC